MVSAPVSKRITPNRHRDIDVVSATSVSHHAPLVHKSHGESVHPHKFVHRSGHPKMDGRMVFGHGELPSVTKPPLKAKPIPLEKPPIHVKVPNSVTKQMKPTIHHKTEGFFGHESSYKSPMPDLNYTELGIVVVSSGIVLLLLLA